MNATNAPTPAETRELHAHLFANLVMQQAGMTMIFLGVTPHPETGKTVFDLEAAQHFIAQLEMLEAKTKGNLDADETAVLKQSLTTVRMAFVQAVERGAPTAPAADKPLAAPAPAPEPAPDVAPESSPAPVTEAASTTASESPSKASGDEERKKFVKKY